MISLAGLKFYDSISQQLRNTATCDEECILPYLAMHDTLIPFIFTTEMAADEITGAFIFNASNNTELIEMPADQFELFTSDGVDYILCRYQTIVEDGSGDYELDCGDYYIVIERGDTSYYSEVFRVMDRCVNTVVIQHSCDMDGIPYLTKNYYSKFFIDSELTKPEYNRITEIVEQEDASEDPSFDRVNKEYKFRGYLLIEPLIDALQTLPIHDSSTITIGATGEVFNSGDYFFSFESDWETDCTSKGVITITKKLIQKSNCCEPIELECPEGMPGLELVDPETPREDVTFIASGSSGCFFELQYKKCTPAGNPVICGDPFISTGQVKTRAEAIAEGFEYSMPDYLDYTYWFRLRSFCHGCDDEYFSNQEAAFV